MFNTDSIRPFPIIVSSIQVDENGKKIVSLPDSPEQALSAIVRLDTCVTVIDAANFLSTFTDHRYVRVYLLLMRDQLIMHHSEVSDIDEKATAEDERNIIDLLVDQIEFADVIILNKADLVTKPEYEKIKARHSHAPSIHSQLPIGHHCSVQSRGHANRRHILQHRHQPSHQHAQV